MDLGFKMKKYDLYTLTLKELKYTKKCYQDVSNLTKLITF